MPDTSPQMAAPFEPSAQIESLLTAVAVRPAAAEGMRAMTQRESEFPSPWQAKLTGIALDPNGREYADQVLDTYWSDEQRQQDTLRSSSTDREVIIGSGFHAAVYAATRVLCGYPKPLVLERDERAGGTFAMTARPTFYLNSRDRAGNAGLAGGQGAALNYLPGADLMRRIRHQTETRPTDPVEQAEVLALKADLLSRIANQRAAEQDPCESITELREIADEAHAIAANVRRLAALHRAPTHENPPPF